MLLNVYIAPQTYYNLKLFCLTFSSGRFQADLTTDYERFADASDVT